MRRRSTPGGVGVGRSRVGEGTGVGSEQAGGVGTAGVVGASLTSRCRTRCKQNYASKLAQKTRCQAYNSLAPFFEFVAVIVVFLFVAGLVRAAFGM